MKCTTAMLYILLLVQAAVTGKVRAQDIEVIGNERLQELLYNCSNEKIKVVNFWATWCRPCVEEMPHFNAIAEKYGEVELLLVSLDAVETLENRVQKFVAANNLKARVVLLDETDFDPIINQVDKRWSGAIPATVFVDCQTGERQFYEKQFDREELEQLIDDLINDRPNQNTEP